MKYVKESNRQTITAAKVGNICKYARSLWKDLYLNNLALKK
jgi:hypothetical protein